LFCAGTYSKILETIAKPALDNTEIRRRTTVRRIQTKTDTRRKAMIYTHTGEVLEFDEVVLTAPLGWLKKNLGAFEPPLPSRLQQAIHSISYGCLEKVSFWNTDLGWRHGNPTDDAL
jgi:predicted NAD/FAD-dependent oxidoreductase